LLFGVASTVMHEVGHQGAALLGLVDSLRADLRRVRRAQGHPAAWRLWENTISEVVADFFSIARIGIGSTQGLVALVNLPPPFVFRPSGDDPHPTPWIRVLLSCAIGDRLYPDPQWSRLAATWRAMYPIDAAPPATARALAELEKTIPALVTLLVDHRPAALRGRRLGAALSSPEVRPDALLRRFRAWPGDPESLTTVPPTVVFALIGQARAAGLLSPEREAWLLRRLIAEWAVASTLATARAAARPAAVPMVLGQPAIWADPPPTPATHLPVAI
jgi:hypothetical protein